MPDSRASTGLATTTRVVEGEIVTAESFNTRVAAWRAEGFNVLTPAISLSSIPAHHKIGVNRVLINPDPAAKEVYQDNLFARGNDVALTKVGLEKVAQCAGISLDEIKRLDSGHVPHFYEYRVYGHWFTFDGARVDRTASKVYDLTDGSLQTKGFSAARLDMARVHAQAGAESRAINRLYRQYGLRQTYTKDELLRPFIVLKLMFDPDLSNPLIAAIWMQIKMGADKLMFPNMPPIEIGNINPLQLPLSARPAGEPQDVDAPAPGVVVHGAGELFEGDPAATGRPAPPLPEKALLVVSVTHDGAGGFNVAVENGKTLHTTERPIAQGCLDAQKAGTRLLFDIETRAGLLEIVEFTAAASSSPY
jgi:hypothetical protein